MPANKQWCSLTHTLTILLQIEISNVEPLITATLSNHWSIMSNFIAQFLILILVLVPVALSEPEAVEALLRRLDSKKSSASVQEAAAKAVLKRLLPTHLDSFEFKIVTKVPSIFLVSFLTMNSGFDFVCCLFNWVYCKIQITSFTFKIFYHVL